MERKDNYAIQTTQAKERFLGYDQNALIRKLGLSFNDEYLYASMLGQLHRIHRVTGFLERQVDGQWVEANSFAEVLTFLDLLCDSREERFLSRQWKDLRDFGLMFHRNLLEQPDPWAQRFDADPEGFRRGCLRLGGKPLPQGDAAYEMELFDGLPVALQLWLGDEEFPPRLRFLLDANAHLSLRSETMHYARGLLLRRLAEVLER